MNKAVSFFLKPFVQCCSIAIVSTIIILLAQLKLEQNVFADQLSTVESFDSSYGFAQDDRANVVNIKVGLNLQNFTTFNVVENNFIADVNLWFEFDSDEISLKELENFTFSKGEILSKSEPVVNGNFVRYDLRVKFSSNLNYKYFPLQDHKINITLDNKNLDGKKISFYSDKNSFSVSESLYTPGWKALNADAKSGVRTINLGSGKTLTYPRVVFSVDFMQGSLKQFIFISLPILIALLVALCAFAMSWRRDFSTIIGLTSASLAAIVSYRYVIEKVSPKTSYYMLSDHLFTFVLLLIFAIFFIDIFFRDSLEKHKNARGVIVFIFYFMVILGWLYLLFIW